MRGRPAQGGRRRCPARCHTWLLPPLLLLLLLLLWCPTPCGTCQRRLKGLAKSCGCHCCCMCWGGGHAVPATLRRPCRQRAAAAAACCCPAAQAGTAMWRCCCCSCAMRAGLGGHSGVELAGAVLVATRRCPLHTHLIERAQCVQASKSAPARAGRQVTLPSWPVCIHFATSSPAWYTRLLGRHM